MFPTLLLLLAMLWTGNVSAQEVTNRLRLNEVKNRPRLNEVKNPVWPRDWPDPTVWLG